MLPPPRITRLCATGLALVVVDADAGARAADPPPPGPAFSSTHTVGDSVTATIDARGLELRLFASAARPSATGTHLHLTRWGRTGDLVPAPLGVCRAAVHTERVEIDRGALIEWYVPGAALEQGFTVLEPPARATGPETDDERASLTLVLEAGPGFVPHVAPDGRSAWWVRGELALSYSGLVAWDADGRELPARMVARGAALQLVVDDSCAVYPVTIDPWIVLYQGALVAADGAAADQLGASVAIEGDAVAVGAPFDDDACVADPACDSGSAYVFERTHGPGPPVWQQTKVVATDAQPGDSFGSSVSLGGGTLVVGARRDDLPALADAGSTYVFVHTGTTWIQSAKLVANDATANDHFGSAVAYANHRAVIGAPAQDHPGLSQAGSAYVYERTPGWVQRAKLTAPTPLTGAHFAAAVAVDGDTIVVGAPEDDPTGTVRSGAVHVFVGSGATWTLAATLVAPDAAASDRFGASVALRGDTLVVGAPQDDALQGSVHVFVRSGSTWSHQARLVPHIHAGQPLVGWSVALSGDTLVAGAPGDALGQPTALWGSVVVFARSGTSWLEQTRFQLLDATQGDAFGHAVGASVTTVVATAPLDDDLGAASGSLRVFEIAGSSDSFCDAGDFALLACPCANAGTSATGCDNAQGTGGVRLEVAVQDVAMQTATLRATGFPRASRPAALLVRGTTREPVPVVSFDGVRCVGLPGFSTVAVSAAQGGESVHALTHPDGAGTFYYQVLYRNMPAGSCTPAALNYSSGRALTW